MKYTRTYRTVLCLASVVKPNRHCIYRRFARASSRASVLLISSPSKVWTVFIYLLWDWLQCVMFLLWICCTYPWCLIYMIIISLTTMLGQEGCLLALMLEMSSNRSGKLVVVMAPINNWIVVSIKWTNFFWYWCGGTFHLLDHIMSKEAI